MKILLLAMLGLPVCALADGGLPSQPYIYVAGNAEVEKAADVVTLRFDLSNTDLDQSKADKAVQAQSAKVLAFLKNKGIADSDVIASDISSEEEYDNNQEAPQRRGKLLGYKVTRPFNVRIRNVPSYGKVVDELLAMGVGEFTGVEAGLSNEKDVEDQMWEKAIANAREKAEKTLKPAGMKIDSVFALSPVAFPEIQTQIFGDSRSNEYKSVVTPNGEATASEYRIAPVTVSQTIHVIYLITPAK